jgi:hypothetical protein
MSMIEHREDALKYSWPVLDFRSARSSSSSPSGRRAWSIGEHALAVEEAAKSRRQLAVVLCGVAAVSRAVRCQRIPA